MTAPDRDVRLVRRAALAFAWRTALAVALVVLLAGAVVAVAGSHALDVDAVRDAKDAAVTADDVRDPPPGVFLLLQPARGRIVVGPGTPAALRALRPAAVPDGATRRTAGGRPYQLWTVDRPTGRITAAVDLGTRYDLRNLLLLALAAGGGVGVVAAGGVGWVIGRRAVGPLGEALALQRRFVADAGHELRTPLTVLATRVQLLERRTRGSDLHGEVGQVATDARALDEVLTDLLTAAELRAHPDRGEPLDLATVARQVVESQQVRAAELGVELVPAALAPGPTTGATGPIRRAVAALVDNALAHSPPHGRVTVATGTVTTRTGERRATLEVRDDGPGLDPDRLDELTRRFARGDPPAGAGRRRFGLGLALVREIVEKHGGRLGVGEPAAGGSAVTVTLPARTDRIERTAEAVRPG